MQAVRKNQPKERGNITFHPKDINWSYLNLGTLARTHTKRKIINKIFNEKKKANCSLENQKSKGTYQPPKNIITDNILIKIIFAYSAIKKRTNKIPEYST